MHGAEHALDVGLGNENPRTALGHDVFRVVEVGLELPEAKRRIDGDGDNACADGPKEAKYEIFVFREDECDAIPLFEPHGLHCGAVASARSFDGGKGKRGFRVGLLRFGEPGDTCF